ncbi:MAG: 2OG-Fe(II) oxygenase [Bacteriovoracaceae bacterium]|nr:2OG-Fe(II) oxygenase [Bacteriovoracaceae bacterium]
MKDGFLVTPFPLPSGAKEFAKDQKWDELDGVMKNAVHGELKTYLQQFKKFSHIEHMLALRDGDNPDEEDGIWHDDGSRVLAFSWSLIFFGKPSGGTLGIRPRGTTEAIELGPFDPGTLIIFQTGIDGFEHRTSRVTHGKRLVCAGWCS